MFANLGERHEEADIVARERPELLIFCGLIGLIGNVMPVVAIFWGWTVTEHDLVADTISDLARGEKKWIMDVGFYFHAAGLLALAIAAAHAHLGRAGWSVGIFCLAFLALDVVLLGLWDEFGATAESAQGMSVHTKLSFVLGPLFLLGPLVMAPGVGGISRTYAMLFLVAAGVWAVFATGFKLAPDAIDGLLEKIAVVGGMVWTMPLSFLYLARGYEKSHRVTKQTREG